MSLVSYEPSPDIEAVAEQLRDRGFDARAFTGTDEMFVHLESGVAIHGICVLGWRYPDERWEFTDHPPRLIAPDVHDPIGRWIWDDIMSPGEDRRQLAVTDSDSPHMVAARVAELLPCDPHRPLGRCFEDLWSWQKIGRAGLAPKQWERAWRTHLLNSTRPTGSVPIGEVGEAPIGDPTTLVSIAADAMDTAEVLLGGSLTGSVNVDSIWTTAAQGPLAAMLYAGSGRVTAKGIEWVLQAVDNPDEDNDNPDAPGWYSAARHVAEQPLFANALLRTVAMDPRQRDSVILVMREALSPWNRRRLREESHGE